MPGPTGAGFLHTLVLWGVLLGTSTALASSVRRLAVIVLAIALGSVALPASAQLDSCEIEHAHATLFTQRNLEGNVVYYGSALMETEGCGPGPSQIEATFRPVTGQPSSCAPVSSVRVDLAACTYNNAATVTATRVVVVAHGSAVGPGGAREFTGSCVLVVPSFDRVACELPME